MVDPMPSQFSPPTHLPVMPYTAQQVRMLMHSRTSSNADIEALLLNDPGAILALYRTLELTSPGAAGSVSGPAHALSMIGRDALRDTVNRFKVMEASQVRDFLSPALAYAQAAHAGWYARALAGLLGVSQAVEAQVAALLQHPATLALWQQEPESAARASNATRDGVSYDVAFSAELGEPLSRVNERLSENWRLPALVRESAGDRDVGDRLPLCVSLANRMAITAYARWPDRDLEIQTSLIAQMVSRPRFRAEAWWFGLTADIARRLLPWGYPLAARELLLLPGGEEEIEVPDLPRRKRATPAIPTAASESAEPKPTAASAAKPKAGFSAVLGSAMQTLRETSGTRRAIFAMLSRDRQQLQTRLASGTTDDDPLRRLDLAVRSKQVFSLLLTRPQAVHITPANREKYQAYLTPLPLGEASAAGCYATSVFVKGKPVGILYADGGEMNAEGYQAFRREAAAISRLLEARQKPQAA